MNIFITTSLLLTLVQIIYSFPRSAVTEPPNYPKFGSDFRPRSPAPFSQNLDGYDNAVQRSSNYVQNPYHYKNTVPIKQKPGIRGSTKGAQLAEADGALREKDSKELEEEELEEPDRLSLLLPQSNFDCLNKMTGYYADEELGCEVFHYCQENAKHSWICPEGFTFHQVHLICMPPGGDNICAKSSKFHFVNEYLYKPVNLEEYQQKPNVSLRYHERFYPENYYEDNGDEETQQNIQHRNSVRVPQNTEQVVYRPATLRPGTTLGQVFRSPNEVNIPLEQRRPQYVTNQRFK